ncbi:peptidase S41 [Candidatus Endobugula sertula]|uniref:Peptidase S41 n=1 Tax=Candidatus Endobugula sertula TaxID=62101 RepID=A0A1D2QP40_9GAMM|nr:peptidase S41 [Candidatus Endobugula sertula]
MQNHLHLILLFVIATLLHITVAIAQTSPKSSTDTQQNNTTKEGLPLKELRLFTSVFDHIRRAYVDPISDQQLLENAIKGMLQEIDPHSAYLNADSFQQLQSNTHGNFSGVGIEIGKEGEFIKIIAPIDGTPAQKAGLQAGDLIIKLNQKSTQGKSLDEASKLIRGPIGSSIVFTIMRKGVDKPFDITVIRDTIHSLSVRQKVIDDTIGYIRISQFQVTTGKDFVAAIQQLRTSHPTLNGLIIDLRNNPGGLLQASVQVVDSLINKGTIVYTEGRLDTSNTHFKATEGDDSEGLPIVVLINGGSASASEIVAGALQDQKRALIMGTRTFGKGSVQTILPIDGDKGIKLTTARYFTPNGRSIQAQGIEPDIIVKPATITEIKAQERIRETDLNKHLKNTDDRKKQAKMPDKEKAINHHTEDNQLFEAINLLKGLAILNQNKESTAQ